LVRGALRARHRGERSAHPRAGRRLAHAGDRARAAHRLRPRRRDREEGAPRGHHAARGCVGAGLCERGGLRALGARRLDDRIRTMRRRDFMVAGLAASLPAWAATKRFDRGLLWRVTKDGTRPSHVYGTIHVADARLAQLPPPVRRALDGARSVMLEFVPDGYTRERFIEAAMFLDRQTLEGTIGKPDFERALEVLAPIGL